MSTKPTVLTKVYIGTTASPDVLTEIGDISNIGPIGISYAKVARENIGTGYIKQLKGGASAPSFTLTLNRADADAGQIIVRAAAAAVRGTVYYFKTVEPDGSISQFSGEVFNFGQNSGGINSDRTVAVEIEIDPSTLTTTAGT